MVTGFRKSNNIDLLCTSAEGYKRLRNLINEYSLGPLFNRPVKYLRNIRVDQYQISAFIEVIGYPIEIKVAREVRVQPIDKNSFYSGIPILSQSDLFVQKLLANADRGLDPITNSKDIIDLAVMIIEWGDIPIVSWEAAYSAYGDHLSSRFVDVMSLIRNEKYLLTCLKNLNMDISLINSIPKMLRPVLKCTT